MERALKHKDLVKTKEGYAPVYVVNDEKIDAAGRPSFPIAISTSSLKSSLTSLREKTQEPPSGYRELTGRERATPAAS